MAHGRVDRGVEDNSGVGVVRHVWKGTFGKVEERVNVGGEDISPLLRGQVREGFNSILGTMIQDSAVRRKSHTFERCNDIRTGYPVCHFELPDGTQ